MITKTAIAILAILLASINTNSLYASDADQLQLVKIKGCASCHGTRGQGNPMMKGPRLAGQSQLELEAKLRAYRNGERANTTMTVMTYNLTDGEIKDLAAYFSRF